MKICLLMLGKTRRLEINAVLQDYVKRISRSSPVEVAEVRDAAAALKRLDSEPRSRLPCCWMLAARVYDSEAFAKWIGEQRDRGTREIIFVCGDADGFPDSLRDRVRQKISLSPMTYSHELARAMLAEQIYRAFAILSGSPYPK